MWQNADEMKMSAKVAFWGRQGTGKTTHALRCAMALHRQLGKPGSKLYFLDTENCAVTIRNVLKSAGIPCLVAQTSSSTEAYVALKQAEKAGDCSVLVIDSMTDLYKRPRVQWMLDNKKDQIPLSKYVGIDKPYHELCEQLKWSPLNIVYTLKEKGETDTVDEHEYTYRDMDGKDANYIARVKVHMNVNKQKKDNPSVYAIVTDDAAPGKQMRVSEPEQEVWDKLMQRFA